MNTPIKSQQYHIRTDLAHTQNQKRGLTCDDVQNSDMRMDRQPTQKKCDILNDRLLRKNEFKYIKNNRARMIDWFLEIFSTYSLGW